jgi:hypothetical protein
LLQTINLAKTTVDSEQQFNGFIDLDAMKGDQSTMTFFSVNKQLATFIRDDFYKNKGTEYQFAIGSNR